jgi:hypothetical protein
MDGRGPQQHAARLDCQHVATRQLMKPARVIEPSGPQFTLNPAGALSAKVGLFAGAAEIPEAIRALDDLIDP